MISNKPIKDYVFVFLQFLLFAIYFIPLEITTLQLPAWFRFTALGLTGVFVIFGLVGMLQLRTNLSPFPSPLKEGQLITDGTYRISRHPIYTALIFMSFGFAIYSESLYKALIASIILALFFLKSKYEENLLIEKFPQYKNYKKKTRRFI